MLENRVFGQAGGVGRVPRHAAAATTAVQRRFTHRKIFER